MSSDQLNITNTAAKMENKDNGGTTDPSATNKKPYRSRADSSSDEEASLLKSPRRRSAPITAKNDSKFLSSTPVPGNKARIERFKTAPPATDDYLLYDATVETTLRFAQARLASPRTSNDGLARMPNTPKSRVNDYDDPFLDPLGPSWSYSISAPRSSMKPDANSEKVDGEKKKKRRSTAARRENIMADNEERMRCMRKFI